MRSAQWSGTNGFSPATIALRTPFKSFALLVLALSDHFQCLVLGFEESASIADTEIEELIDERVLLRSCLFGTHIIVIEEKRIVALLEEHELG